MKLNHEQKAEYFELIPLLDPNAKKQKKEVVKMSGARIIDEFKCYRDNKGGLIIRSLIYDQPVINWVAVDHRAEIERMIYKAKDLEDLENMLAVYYAEYALDKTVKLASGETNEN